MEKAQEQVGTLHDLMMVCGVTNHPAWFEKINLLHWPMPHQLEMIKHYQRNMRFGDFSEPGCVSADTEFLSQRGWVSISDYQAGDLVTQWNPDEMKFEWATPSAYIKRPCPSMIHWKTPYTDQMLSHDHRVLLYRGSEHLVIEASQLGVQARNAVEENDGDWWLHDGEMLVPAFPRGRTSFKLRESPDGMMYCFKVPSSFLVLRRNGQVFTTGNCGKTYPAQTHAILMAAMGNRVCFAMPPKLIPQAIQEMKDYFSGVENHLYIDHLACSPDQKRKKEEEWEASGWPDILLLSYDVYRTYNDKDPMKNIGTNLWRARRPLPDGSYEYVTYFKEDGTPVSARAQPFTGDGRPINRKGKAKNPKQMLLKERGYNVLFMDEAHALCGMDSILSKSVAEMSHRLGDEVAIYLMTGTPVPTHLHDVYGLIRLINPDAYLNKASFIRQHCVMREFHIPLPNGKLKKLSSIESYVDTERIYDALWTRSFRVQKRDVIQMPDPIITEVPVKLSGVHAKLYKDVINNQFAVLGDAVLAPDNQSQLRHMALQLVSCPQKFAPGQDLGVNQLAAATDDLLNTIDPSPQRKVIIFAYYRATIDELALRYAKYKAAVVYGGTKASQEEISRFQDDPETSVLVIQWVSGGAGLNLQVASYIIFYEIPTSPKDAKQGIARADRKGQMNIVNVYFMRVYKTLFDRNFKALLKNEESNNQVIKDRKDLLHELLG